MRCFLLVGFAAACGNNASPAIDAAGSTDAAADAAPVDAAVDAAPDAPPDAAVMTLTAEFTDTVGDDIVAMWPAAVLPAVTTATDVTFECRDCATCELLQWSMAQAGFTAADIAELATYATSRDVPSAQDDIEHWTAGTVAVPTSCFSSGMAPRYTFTYWNTPTGMAHFHLTERRSDCSVDVWQVMGPRDADGSEGNYCQRNLVGGQMQQGAKAGEWFRISIVGAQ